MTNKKMIKGIKGIIEKNKIRPALETVQVKNNVLTATDLSTSVKIKGVTAPNGCYTVAQLENNCLDKVKYDFDEYPNIEARKETENIEIEINLIEGIKNTLFSVASAENIACNGVRIISTGEKLIFVATDTYRMIKVEYFKNLPVFEITLPEKTCKTILALLDNSTCIIKIYKNRIELFQGDITIISKIIELAYPNWKSVYDSIDTKNTLIFSNKELFEALKELLPIAKGNYNAKNGAVFEVVNNKIKITAINDDMKKELIINTVSNINNNCFKFALNIKFIIDFLKSATDNIIIKYSTDKAAFVIDDYILMPLALASFDMV